MIFPIGDDNIERGHPAIFSYGFIILNIAAFALQMSLPQGSFDQFFYTFGAIPANITSNQNLHTLVTGIFLHGGVWHLLGNMLFLWIFADNIEATIGNGRFVLFYLMGGVLASLAQIAVDPTSEVPIVGASGAIAAVMGAYIVMFPKSRIRMLFLIFFSSFYVPAYLFLGFWLLQNIFSGMGFSGDASVAWWAHIGGFAFGVIAGFYFRSRFLKVTDVDLYS